MIFNIRQYSLALIAILLTISFIGYLASQSSISYHAEADSYIDIWITPAIAISTDTGYELQWTSARITSIHLNEQGKIGEYQEIFDNTCQIHEFMVDFENGGQETFRVRPFKLLHPLIISLIFISLTAISVLATTFKIPVIISIGNYFAPLFDWESDKFWHRWIVVILFNICLFTGFLYLVDTCQSQAILSIGQHFQLSHGLLIATGIISFFTLLLSILRFPILLTFQRMIRLIPYPIVITVIFGYWGVSTYLLLTFSTLIDEFMVPPLILLIFSIGSIILHTRLQPDDSQSKPRSNRYDTRQIKPIFAIIISVVVWILAYRTDWITFIHNDMLQMAVGIILYMLPGVLFALILRPTIKNWTTLLTTGFMLSFVLSVILWLISVILGTSADFMQWMYTLVSLVIWLRLIKQEFPSQLFQLKAEWKLYHTLLFSLGILCIFVVLSLIVEPGFGHMDWDERNYKPLVIHYAQSESITMLDPYLGHDGNMLHRMWLAVWTVPQSLMLTFSQLHVLTSTHLIAFYLTIFVFIVFYDITRRFGVMESFCLMSIPIFAYFIVTHLGIDQFGFRFLKTLIEDKYIASFILSPLAIITTFEYLHQQSRTRLFLTIVSIMSVMLGHPTVYFNACLVIGTMTCLYVLTKSHQWRHIIVVGLICGIWMTVPFGVRIVSEINGANFLTDDVEELLELTERNNRSNISETGEFLGINPELLSNTTYVILGIAFVLSIIHFKKHNEVFFILPIVLLLLAVLNPVTSLLIGKVISYPQLWRVPWMIPFGTIGAMALWLLYLSVHKLHSSTLHIFHFGMLILTSWILITSFNIALSPPYKDSLRAPAKVGNLQDKLIYIRDEAATPLFRAYENAVQIGSYIRSITQEKVYILADARQELNYYIPSIGADLHTIAWYTRTMPNISSDEWQARNEAYDTLFSDSLSVDTFVELVEKYQVNYILLSKKYEHLEMIMEQSGIIEHEATQFGSLRLWKRIPSE